jgi:cell division protein FtsQ
MKSWIKISLWTLSICSVIALFGFVTQREQQAMCEGIDINIQRKNKSNEFISAKEVEQTVRNLGYSIEGQYMSDFELAHLEQVFKSKPSVKDAEVYTTVDHKLKLDITERTPIARLFNMYGESFYLDREGTIMPLSNNYTARVMVINGKLNIPYSTLFSEENEQNKFYRNKLNELFELVQFIHKDPFWRAQISQVFIDKYQEVVLIPKVGNHKIVVGEWVDLAEKFGKLKILYNKGLPNTGWNEYHTINLKFKNQIVCSKK